MGIGGQPRGRVVAVMGAFLTMSVVGFTLWTLAAGSDAVAGMQAARFGERSVSATPVAGAMPRADPFDGEPATVASTTTDPLDGDPSGGRQRKEDSDAPKDLDQLAIERSGRPKEAERSDVAYDGNLETVWSPGADLDESWLWFDVGDGRRVKAIRWLAEGAGTIEIAISTDRQRWETLETVSVNSGWSGVQLREDARYVRLGIAADEERELPGIAEVAIYGRSIEAGVSKAQTAGDDRKRERDRQEKREAPRTADASQNARDDTRSQRASERDESDAGGATVSAKKGKSHCKGKRARCRSQEGKVSVEEDCTSNGSCTIDVRADGGSATCDASGGRKNKAGDGEGKRAGDGGECESVADGGTVTLGDVNP